MVDPRREDPTRKILDFTGGLGAAMYLEATGLPDKILPSIEDTIWEGKYVGSKVVLVARADVKAPLNCEVHEVKKVKIAGAQGHSGYGTFPRVISCMASGMDMTRMITKKVVLEEVPENIVMLQTDKRECKVTCVM